MTKNSVSVIAGRAAALRIDNLDTDQIMPKQFLRGIDKAGLAAGLLYDLRFDAQDQVRPDFVLNRLSYQDIRVLVGGSNFGCGSSREHAVWGLLQYGIQAVVAASFGEIFFSNAMNSGLMLVTLPQEQIDQLMLDAEDMTHGQVRIDINTLRLTSAKLDAPFALSSRHQRMFLEGLDVIGLSLAYREQIRTFAETHWTQQPWLRNVAARALQRLSQEDTDRSKIKS